MTRLLFIPLLSVSCAMPPRGDANELTIDAPATWHATRGGGAVDSDWWQKLGDARLQKAIERTLTHNYDLRAAHARVLAATAQAKIAGAPGMPQLEAALSGMRQRMVFVGFPFGSGGGPLSNTFENYGASLNASWEVDVWGRVGAAKGAALADQRAALADLRGVRLSLAGQTAKSWYAAVEASQQVALAKRSVQSYRVTESQVNDRFAQGMRTALDLRLAKSLRIAAEAQHQQWEQRLAQARRQLQALQGRYPDGKNEFPDQLPIAGSAIAAGQPASLVERRPDLVAATLRLRSAGYAVDEAQAALYPKLSFSGSIGTNTERMKDLLDFDFLFWNVAGNLVKPILDGGRGRANRARAIAREHEAIASFAKTSLRAFTEVETLLASEGLVRQQLTLLAAASTEAIAAQQLAEERYRTGIGQYLAVLESQRGALTLQSQRITTNRMLLELRVDLHVALGGGFAETSTGGQR